MVVVVVRNWSNTGVSGRRSSKELFSGGSGGG